MKKVITSVRHAKYLGSKYITLDVFNPKLYEHIEHSLVKDPRYSSYVFTISADIHSRYLVDKRLYSSFETRYESR